MSKATITEKSAGSSRILPARDTANKRNPRAMKSQPEQQPKGKMTKDERKELDMLREKFYLKYSIKYRFLIDHDTLDSTKKDKGYKKISEKNKQEIQRYFELEKKEINSFTQKELDEIGKENYRFLHQDDWKYDINRIYNKSLGKLSSRK